MKRLLAFMLTAILAVSLVACDTGETPSDDATPTGGGVNTTTNTTKSDETGSQEQPVATPSNLEIITFANREWLVLAERGSETLLLSRYAVFPTSTQHDGSSWNDFTSMHTQNGIWRTSRLHTYLNSFFLYESEGFFTPEERARIVPTTDTDETHRDNWSDWEGDYVFLLSVEEIEMYLPTQESRFLTHEFSVVEEEISYPWWTRSEGSVLGQVFVVGNDCSIIDMSAHASMGVAIRPAMWVRLDD